MIIELRKIIDVNDTQSIVISRILKILLIALKTKENKFIHLIANTPLYLGDLYPRKTSLQFSLTTRKSCQKITPYSLIKGVSL